jgi:RNA polymerase sigma-70 factor (ECF subfamily)
MCFMQVCTGAALKTHRHVLMEGMTVVADRMTQAAESHRAELLAYCYRMTGSLHDAQDLVQETMLRAWRSAETYDPGRASVRTWLYRIATNLCVDALAAAKRRALPADLSAPSTVSDVNELVASPEIPWLEPFPDSGLDHRDPAALAAERESVRLAFVAALQHLPPLQRAVLILRDVLAFRAAETAALLETTPTAVNSALQRARAQLAAAMPDESGLKEPTEQELRGLLDRYVAAFESKDLDALKRALRDDALLQMPPYAAWFLGRDAIAEFFATVFARGGDYRLVPVGEANARPAYALYRRRGTPGFEALNLHLFTVGADGVARVDVFHAPDLFPAFGLPTVL